MNRQSAYKILNLDDTATFDEAKQAYRHLAKKYHPDVNRNKTGENDDGRMKQINLAFLYLTPILRSTQSTGHTKKEQAPPEKNSVHPEPDTGLRKNRPLFFESFLDSLKQMVLDFSRLFKQEKPSARFSKETESKSKPFKKPFKPEKNFNQVFSKVYGNQPEPEKKKKLRPGSKFKKSAPSPSEKAFQGYQTHMAYKKKMAAAKKRKNETTRISRVEKIHPISPVQPVQHNNR